MLQKFPTNRIPATNRVRPLLWFIVNNRNRNGGGTPTPPEVPSILLEDGTSSILMEDNSSPILLEPTP